MTTAIAGMRVESNTTEDAIDAAETLAAIRAIEADWPLEAPEVI
jgi:hypothetical protein